MTNKTKLALLNIMPNAIEYEGMIRAALADVDSEIEFYPIRLATHQYHSSGGSVAAYPTFDQLIDEVNLDLLIVTGAPVEHLPYHEISYWEELSGIIAYAGSHLRSVLGICFGGLALGKHLGIERRMFDDKLFGVFSVQSAAPAATWFDHAGQSFNLALSTWALLDKAQVNDAIGSTLNGIVSHPVFGHLMLETPDRRLCLVLGHPEYSADTLRKEWLRDIRQGLDYARQFEEADFARMDALLAANPSSLLARWVASHAARSPRMSSELLELDTK